MNSNDVLQLVFSKATLIRHGAAAKLLLARRSPILSGRLSHRSIVQEPPTASAELIRTLHCDPICTCELGAPTSLCSCVGRYDFFCP